MPATLLQFAQVNDAAAATTRKLEKQAILAAYLRALDEPDLRLAVRYAAGRPFAATDERVLNVGGAIVRDVILDLLQTDPDALHNIVVRSGEVGEALSALWPARPAAPAANERELCGPAAAAANGGLGLLDLSAAFDRLAAVSATAAKRGIIRRLFLACAHPREAAYLAKIIFGDLRTGVQEGVLQAAVAQAFDAAPDQLRRALLLLGDLDQAAVLARRKTLNVAAFRLFHPIQFMLASPRETPEAMAEALDGRDFYIEDKLDGIRAQVHKSAGRVAVYTRTMDRADASFPDIVAALQPLPGEFLLDGEIVPCRDGAVLPFAHVQKRLGRKTLTPRLLEENPVAFVAFDILCRDGAFLMDEPLRQRKAALSALAEAATTAGALRVSPFTLAHTPADIAAAFEQARGRRNEGIVLKDPDSVYSPGRRGLTWLKLKTHLPTLDCVVTAAEYGHGKRRNVLSDYTFAVWDRDPSESGAALVNIGKAFSGVTDEEIAELTELFLRLTTRRSGRVHLVEPHMVLEIACDQIQTSSRHASGYALRFPRIKRLRRDKRPEDADTLARVIEIYQSAPNFARPLEALPPPREPTLFD